MSLSRQIGVLVVALIAMSTFTELSDQVTIIGVPGFVGSAEARVGRPLTPVSVAGAARRTGRRCAAGVYNC